MIKLRAARNAARRPLGAEFVRNLSQTRQTRYDDEPAAMAGNNQVSSEKTIISPLIALCHPFMAGSRLIIKHTTSPSDKSKNSGQIYRPIFAIIAPERSNHGTFQIKHA